MKQLKIGKKSGLKYFGINDIRDWKPCYDPKRHLREVFRGTAVTILKNDSISIPDRLWVVLRTDVISERVMRLFAVWSYRQTLAFLPNQDPRTVEAANVAERFANGEATPEQLTTARHDAADAAFAAAAAADAVVAHAAFAAASAAADAASASADAAAADAAFAAYAAADAAAYAAAASRTKVRNTQIERLIDMIKIEGKDRVKNRKVK